MYLVFSTWNEDAIITPSQSHNFTHDFHGKLDRFVAVNIIYRWYEMVYL